MEKLFKILCSILVIIIISGVVHSCSTRDTSFSEYEITGTRYYVKTHEHGTFTKKTDYSEYIEIFYNSTKLDMVPKNIKISDKTCVREYNNNWDGTEVYMTQEDYKNALAEVVEWNL